jgi:glutamyl-tRNA synthetase
MNDEKRNSEPVVTRIPPSPTGNLHIGTARMALFNYLFAKQHGGKVFLRLEDTDKSRSKPEFEANIKESLEWLGLIANNQNDKTWRQSERTDVYKKYLKQLIDSGKAYESLEEKNEKEGGVGEGQKEKRNSVIRFKNTNEKITFHDLVRGNISFDTTELGDIVIAKSLGEPLYHLAVVVDDFEMGVTHVVRGEDHISNTPRQILLQRALGFPPVEYAHIPLILAPDRSKMSKRHGAVAVTEYRNRGFLPEAVINYLALLGWNPGTNREIFSLDELVKEFRLEKVQKGGAIFDEKKLRWINKEYLKLKPPAFFEKIIVSNLATLYPSITPSKEMLKKIIPLMVERIETTGEIGEILKAGDFIYFFEKAEQLKYSADNLLWKQEKSKEVTSKHLSFVVEALSKITPELWKQENIKSAIWDYAEKEGRGNVLWPMRYSLSGKEKSPNPFALAEILEKDETLARLRLAIKKLS